jgi:hypothetical protein
MTRPCRRMIRHLLQIFLTLGLTFTVLSLIRSVCDDYLYRYTIRPRLRS